MDDNDLPRLTVVIEKTRLHQCAWCGTAYSEKWEFHDSKSYCSHDCMFADLQGDPSVCCMLILGLVMIPVSFIFQVYYFLILGLIFLVISLLMFINDRPPEGYTERVPRNSRLDEGIKDIYLLRALPYHVECPNCDANLDISKINEDMIYHCEYCGAEGVVELIKTKSQTLK